MIDIERLKGYLLNQYWHRFAEIVPDYMPPYPTKDTKPAIVVRFNGFNRPLFLRWSRGPLQGFFWDVYGDNFDNEELALIALSQAPCPPLNWTLVANIENVNLY